MPQAAQALRAIWNLAGLPEAALAHAGLTGADPVFPSSFAVGAAAQSTLAAAGLAACELAHARGAARRPLSLDMREAAIESTGWFTLDGKEPDFWDPFTGLYRCLDGHVRIHANFAHHRDGALQVLGLSAQTHTRADAERLLGAWRALDFEAACAERGLVATALRSFEQWDATPQGQAVAGQPLMTFTRIGDAPPRQLPALPEGAPPLSGLRVLDLTRILAGPVAGRTLAVLGADVMLVNGPHLPNISAIAETSRGKRSAQVDLRTEAGRAALWRLVDTAHVFSQGYRPGGLAQRGFSPEALARRRPGIVYVSLTAYGTEGPWAQRRGFDSLVQTAMGFNHAEGLAAGAGQPRPLPMQILDQASGFLMAFGAAAALWRQQREGGSWHVEVSLAQTGHWLRGLGRVPGGLDIDRPELAGCLDCEDSGFGLLCAVRPALHLDGRRLAYGRRSMPPGSAAPRWQ
ncbi:CoA transferase [Orrella sp. JC864]|uniref:CoA transferase n=1 Tax=Orrella sp. JC864 TaxID=3120298 RepID=UPI00300BC27A